MYFDHPLSPDPHRARLLAAMAVSVAAKGYAEITIADVVREASVSRRTFYEHFADKADCLLALLEAGSALVLEEMRASIDSEVLAIADLIDAVAQRYLGVLGRHPALLRTLLLEVVSLGARGLAIRRGVHEQFATWLLEVVGEHPQMQALALDPPDPLLVMAAVGGINTLVLQAILEGHEAQLPELSNTASALLRAVLLRKP